MRFPIATPRPMAMPGGLSLHITVQLKKELPLHFSQLARLAATVIFLLAAFPLQAQESSPESALRSYFVALQREGIVAASDHMHPAELQRFKTMLMPLFQSGTEAQIAELNRTFFGPAATTQAASTASPREFMKAFLSLAARQPALASVKLESPDIVGSVREGDTVHFITRTRAGAGDIAITQMEVVSLRQDGDTWRMLLSGSLEGMAQALRQRGRRQ